MLGEFQNAFRTASDNNQKIGKLINKKKHKIQRRVEKIMTETEDLPDFKSKKFKIAVWKLVLSALLIPILNAFGLMMKDYIAIGEWDWTIMLIIINAVSIPAVINWLTSTFNLQAAATAEEYEKTITKLKDERNAYKIKSGLSEYALEIAGITKPDYDKYVDKI